MANRRVDRRGFLKASALTGAALAGGALLPSRSSGSEASNRGELHVPASHIPVTHEADVVVIGAGPGGFGAALRAARMGASTVVIEKYDMPGGVHTSGLQGAYNSGIGGIHTELMQRLLAEGHVYTATEKTYPSFAGNPLSHYDARLKPGSAFTRRSFNPEGGGSVMLKMLEEAGVTALYNCTFLDVVTKPSRHGNSAIDAVIVQTASGLQAIRGKIFVDGSGTAEIVERAGAPFVRGGGLQPSTVATDGVSRPVPGGLLWIMNDIDFEATAAYQRTRNDPMLSNLISAALTAGDIPPDLYRPRMEGKCVYASLYIGHPTLDMSPTQAPGTFIFWQNVPYEWALHMDDSAEDMARAKVTLRRFVDAEAAFLREYVPGFERAYVSHVGRYLGIRDGRHPIGEYVLTMDDALSGRSFPDAVTAPMTKTFQWDCNAAYTFQVPYRCFLPQKVENLLLTGASMSFSYETIFMVMRNFPWCMQTGEIAGFAAAESLAQGVPPSEFHWKTPLF